MSASGQVGLEFYRQFGRSTQFARRRPEPPRSLQLSGGKITWDAPRRASGTFTHYRIYADNEFTLVRQVPSGQRYLQDNLVALRVFVSSYNETLDLESARIVLQGPISLTGGGGPYTIAWASPLTIDLINGGVQVVTLGGNTIIDAPVFGGASTLPANVDLIMILIQDATAGRAVVWDAAWVGVDTGMSEIGRPNIYTAYWFKTISVSGTVRPVLLSIPFTGKEWA